MRYFSFLVFAICVLSSCKSQFETVRSSNDPKLILKAADQYYTEKDYYKAQALYELSIPFFRGKAEAEDLFYNYAYTHYYLEEYILASHYFKQFSQTFYNSERREEAAFMAAYSNYELSPNSKLDQTFTQKAIDGLQEFVNAYPRSERIEQCNEIMDDLRLKQEKKAFDQGALYFKISQYQSALASFEIMLKDYPESKRAEEVRMMMIKASYILADNSYIDKKKERYDHTVKLYNDYVKRHGKSKEARKIYNDAISKLEKLGA